MKRLIGSILFVCLSIGTWTVMAAQLVVVASTATGIKPGQVIDGAKKLEIPAGASVTLVSQAGKSMKLAGPYSGAPGGGSGGGDGKAINSISKLFSGSGAESGTLGAMRSAGGGVPSDAQLVDISRSGTHCYSANDSLQLWRDKASSAAVLSMRNLAGGSRMSASWPAGDATVEWPEGLALEDGAAYLARIKGRPTAAKITLRTMPGDLDSDVSRALWMADNGCAGQARRLLSNLE